MWPSNLLTERLSLKFPIILAPMGIITTPALAAAVSNAGGLGGIGMWGLTAEEAARRIAGFRQLSPGSLNVNYPLWPEPRYTADASEAMRRHLLPHYDDKGLGPVPQPQDVASDVTPSTLRCCSNRSLKLSAFISDCRIKRSSMPSNPLASSFSRAQRRCRKRDCWSSAALMR